MDTNFSEACERNKEPILKVLEQFIHKDDRRVLEIGAGTGQHAMYFAPKFPFLEWYPTELKENILKLKSNLSKVKISNIQSPVICDVSKDDFPKVKFDIVFTANTFHIMQWKQGKSFIKLLGNRLRKGSRAIFYGPFKFNGEFTTPSNEKFDIDLKVSDPLRGIRSFEDINKAMLKSGFELLELIEMPANNHMIIYQRLEFTK